MWNKLMQHKDVIKKTALQFIKFGIVGVSNTVISLAVYYFCTFVLDFHYQFSNFLGFIIGVTNSYVWNSRYVFSSGQKMTAKEHLRTYCKTVASYGLVFLISIGLLWFWVEIVHISETWAPIANLFITIPLNFLLSKFWAYKKK